MTGAKMTPGICYVAGLTAKSKQEQKSAVGITTSIPEIEQRFIKIALTEFGIEPTKIMITYNEGFRHIYFFHSRVAKQLKNIVDRQTYIFKKKDELSASYVAGMFDAGGHYKMGSLSIDPIRPADAIMLSNIGIRTKNNTIMNGKDFIAMVGNLSAIMKNIIARK